MEHKAAKDAKDTCSSETDSAKIAPQALEKIPQQTQITSASAALKTALTAPNSTEKQNACYAPNLFSNSKENAEKKPISEIPLLPPPSPLKICQFLTAIPATSASPLQLQAIIQQTPPSSHFHNPHYQQLSSSPNHITDR